MEIGQILCNNLGMTRDTNISALGKSKDGTTNFAFENHNIRILAVNDNTKFSVTNEKSTILKGTLIGTFIGGCKLNKYLVVFTKDTAYGVTNPDYIYRLEFTLNNQGLVIINIVTLYNGNLNFSLNNPIEALGYYESEEILKVYWVDGLNKNRFINIVKEVETLYYISLDTDKYYYKSTLDITLDDGLNVLRALTKKNSLVVYYAASSLGINSAVWTETVVTSYMSTPGIHTLAGLTSYSPSTLLIVGTPSEYDDFSFDFLGYIDSIPTVTIEKTFEKAGSFLAGTLLYFMTYYNKFGVETCIIWNSDLQYIALADRGAKADEAVSCGFDFTITNIDESYDYLRIYSCYRSGINGVANANIVTDISLKDKSKDDVIYFTDLGVVLTNVNAADLPYVGGLNIIANTLDYKLDTMFLGDIKLPETSSLNITFNKTNKEISDLKDANGNNCTIKDSNAITWVYKKVSKNIPLSGDVYSYTSELRESLEEIQGFKWREVYRFGILFMDSTGLWTSAYWIGDKYNELRPIRTNDDLIISYISTDTILISDGVFKYNGTYTYLGVTYYEWIDTLLSSFVYTTNRHPLENLHVYQKSGLPYTTYLVILSIEVTGLFKVVPDLRGISYVLNFLNTANNISILYTGLGDYIAEATVDLVLLCNTTDLQTIQSLYRAYRLLVADMDVTSRRIIELGVICPTMFNYYDRYYNRPYSIPSWMFRPRTKLWNTNAPINRHYDTFSESKMPNTELLGIVTKKVPGYDPEVDKFSPYNAYVLIIGANDGGSYIKWKLIYYKAGDTDADKLQTAEAFNKVINDLPDNSSTLLFFQGKYKVVSSGWEKKACGKWDEVYGNMVERITSDTINSGESVVISASMLPTALMLKDIAYEKGDTAAIWAIIGLVILAIAAAVSSVFTAGATLIGTMGAAAAIVSAAAVTNTIVSSVLTSMLTGVALASTAGAATIASLMDRMHAIDRLMAAKGFLPINIDGHDLAHRQLTPWLIKDIIGQMFSTTPGGYNNAYYVLDGDPDTPFENTVSTREGSLGCDYTAYVQAGIITFEDGREINLKERLNVFCVDESIVTLNAPDVEENNFTINNSEAFKLELVGAINVSAVRGEYDLQTTTGLNNSAEVLRGRFVSELLITSKILGLVKGLLYLDTHIDEATIAGTFPLGEYSSIPRLMVAAKTALYTLWMWNRDTSAGLWLPGMTLLDPIQSTSENEVPITIPGALITRKLFSNLRYSPYTVYQLPFTIDIESPVVCLDSLAMLKKFTFNGGGKFYYENINTISVNSDSYYLLVNNLAYPETIPAEGSRPEINLLNLALLRDPVNIKYRLTPHILIPFRTDGGISTILPYTQNETSLYPLELYTTKSDLSVEELGNVLLDGIRKKGNTNQHYFNYVLADNCNLAEHLGYKIENNTYVPEEATLVELTLDLVSLSQPWTVTSDSKWYDFLLVLSSSFTELLETILEDSTFLTPPTLLLIYDNSKYLKWEEWDNTKYSVFYSTWKVLGNNREILVKLGGTGALSGYWFKVWAEESVSTTYKKVYVKCLMLTLKMTISRYGVTYTDEYITRFNEGDSVRTATLLNNNDLTYKLIADSTSSIGYKIEFNYWGEDPLPSTVDTTKFTTIYLDLPYIDNYISDSKPGVIPEGLSSTSPNVYLRINDTDITFDKLLILGLYSSGTWNQSLLVSWDKTVGSTPYLFMGELVKKVFDYNTWMGGTTEYGLLRLTWNVASKVTDTTSLYINYTWGDTFYQRWDCQKTYPYTELDKNSISDILSFMLESHKNLDGRCDINRGIDNLINVRPTNTVYNDTYSLKDNFFSYLTLDSKFDKKHFEADIVWSLTKNNNDDIDKWTCLVATNEMSLDGRYGTIRKIINLNDNIITFLDLALSQVRYNELVALATTAGLPVLMGNSGKVEGYRIVSDTTGCHNKFSISKNSAGVFYIDDYNKSFNAFSVNEGSANIGLLAEFSSWFKHNITGNIWTPNTLDGFRASYDEITSDLYLSNNQYCLIYNTLLKRFTSFMSYLDTPIITSMFNSKGNSLSFALHNTRNQTSRKIVNIHLMFAGSTYGYIYGSFAPYSIEYRITPDPLHDSIFTNYSYTADWTDPIIKVDGEDLFGPLSTRISRRFTTFDEVKSYNEYLSGVLKLDTARMGVLPIKTKFRVWRGNIPRDGSTLSLVPFRGDRMRNPWIHLKFEKNIADDSKMTFHNLTVIYYNQYGRY